MSNVGEIEKKTQACVVALFKERLHYDYLGDWAERANSNIEPTLQTPPQLNLMPVCKQM
jgi:type I restriction enzyme R subunit